MEVEHSITEAAEQALTEESAEYVDRLRAEAVKEALAARGTPVEVTASDIRKAAHVLRADRADNLAKRHQFTYTLIEAYLFGGVAMAVLSLVVLALPEIYYEFEFPVPDRIVGLLGLLGGFLAAVSGAMRWYLRRRVRR